MVPAEPGRLLPGSLMQGSICSDTGKQAVTTNEQGFPLPILLSMNFEGRCAE
jgi:hypothetical protein